MLNYGIRYECTPFSPAGAPTPPTSSTPTPALCPIPPAHAPRPAPAQIPNYRILWDFLSLPGKHA
jgi:hypothetical protein